MEKIKIQTSFNIELEFETPEFHKRLFAWMIDFVILISYYLIVIGLLSKIAENRTSADNNLPFIYNLSALYLLLFVPLLTYHLVCELTMNGQSIGKKMMHIKVMSEDGARPSIYQYLIRWLTRPFDFFFFGLIGLLTVVLSKKNQRLSEMAAGTLVIKTKIQTDIDDTVFFELNDDYLPRYAAVMRLSDRDMNTIKGVLNNHKRFNNFDVAACISEKIRSVLNITDYEEPIVFLETLLKDYNYFSGKE